MAGCPLPYARSLSEVSPTLQWHRWAANDAALLHVCAAGRKPVARGEKKNGRVGRAPLLRPTRRTIGQSVVRGPWSVVSRTILWPTRRTIGQPGGATEVRMPHAKT